MASTHVATHLGNVDHQNSLNGKAAHIHTPRIYNASDQTFNTIKISGGGCQECGVCGEILTDCAS